MNSDKGDKIFRPVLLLNSTYEPLTVVGWQKAMTLVVLKKVEVLEVQPTAIHTASCSFVLPSVLRLTQRVSVPLKRVNFTRSNIFLRDAFSCQYCGKVFPRHKLTLDHVVPKSRGGATSWENMTTCCGQCNRTKGDRTPGEANMPLLSTPKEPRWSPILIHKRNGSKLPSSWKQYLWF